MKEQIKGSLTVGVHFFIKEQRLTGRLIVQQKPIKSWSYYDNNDLFELQIKPTLSILDKVESYHKRDPYQLFANGEHSFSCESWKDALESATWRFERIAKSLGVGSLNLEARFLKNEPRITFSEVHELLKKAGVEL